MVEPRDSHAGGSTPEGHEEEGVRELDDVGAMTIQMYQTQVQISANAWSQFSLYSAIVVALSLVLMFLGEWLEAEKLLPAIGYLLIPLLAYLALAAGTFVILGHAMKLVVRIRGEARLRTGWKLEGSDTAEALRYFVIMVALVVLIYVLALHKTYGRDSPAEVGGPEAPAAVVSPGAQCTRPGAHRVNGAMAMSNPSPEERSTIW